MATRIFIANICIHAHNYAIGEFMVATGSARHKRRQRSSGRIREIELKYACLAALTASFAFPSPGQADQAASICGNVSDAQGRAVPNATISLPAIGATASSDANGDYCLRASGGHYRISASARGYRPGHHDIEVAGGGRTTVNFVLGTISVD